MHGFRVQLGEICLRSNLTPRTCARRILKAPAAINFQDIANVCAQYYYYAGRRQRPTRRAVRRHSWPQSFQQRCLAMESSISPRARGDREGAVCVCVWLAIEAHQTTVARGRGRRGAKDSPYTGIPCLRWQLQRLPVVLENRFQSTV